MTLEKICIVENGKITAVNVSLFFVVKIWLKDFLIRKIRFP